MRVVDPADVPELLADYRDLTDSALRRVSEPAEGLYIAESLTILGRALDAGHRPRSVLTSPKWLEPLELLLADHHAPDDLPVIVGDEARLEATTGFHVHRGTLASMNRPELPDVTALVHGATTLVVLEDIVDHTNVGALFRSVAAMGADAVLVTERCADPLYRRSIRVSMGTVFQVPWSRAPWSTIVHTLHDQDWTIVGMALGDNSVDFDRWLTHAPPKVALVLGSEGQGLSQTALEQCDVRVTIAMSHGVDSLNVAAAGAVALYGLSRRPH